VPRVLSIAGSDSGGGAGIQADLKAFARCGAHGMTAITAITAQNTVGVQAVHQIPPEIVLAQVRSVCEDIGIDAVKIGMLGTAETVEAVARTLGELAGGVPVVVDPVMVAESGARLLEPEAEAALVELLLPLATVATPNLEEARVLAAVARPTAGSGDEPRAGDLDHEELARAVHALGPGAVVVTGGHSHQPTGGRAGQTIDVFFDGAVATAIAGQRYPDGAAHGSGCTHSSALAALLAWGRTPLEAARGAQVVAGFAVRDGLRELGAGAGPVDVIGLARPTLPGP
jgi:hydroxymethylpyrimidine/phosphomethylpyrimidine kinase